MKWLGNGRHANLLGPNDDNVKSMCDLVHTVLKNCFAASTRNTVKVILMSVGSTQAV